MADEADLAFETEQKTLSSAIVANSKQTKRLHPVGECHFCGVTTNSKQLFCDSDCADDWDRTDKQRRALGL